MLAATANAVLLAKCLRQHMWDRSRLQCRQLACINRPTAERLASAGILTLEELQTTDARRIEALAKRNYPFGQALIFAHSYMTFCHALRDVCLLLDYEIKFVTCWECMHAGNQVMEELKCIMPPAVTLELTATGECQSNKLLMSHQGPRSRLHVHFCAASTA